MIAPRLLLLGSLLCLAGCAAPPVADRAAQRPNVLFIAVDDMNDWVGHLGTTPRAMLSGQSGEPGYGVKMLVWQSARSERA